MKPRLELKDGRVLDGKALKHLVERHVEQGLYGMYHRCGDLSYGTKCQRVRTAYMVDERDAEIVADWEETVIEQLDNGYSKRVETLKKQMLRMPVTEIEAWAMEMQYGGKP